MKPNTAALTQIVRDLAEELGHSPLQIDAPGAPTFILVSEARYNQLLDAEARLAGIERAHSSDAQNARLLADFEAQDTKP